eukprot:SAG22_NODE_1499_length_4287_cov_10.199857_3_plen_323_part_00
MRLVLSAALAAAVCLVPAAAAAEDDAGGGGADGMEQEQEQEPGITWTPRWEGAGEGPSRVEALTLTTLDWRVANGSDWFVKFYAPWCPHCRMMGPVLEEVAAGFLPPGAEGSRNVVIAKVDVEMELALGIRFLVGSYPTLALISDGGRTLRYYTGPRHAEAISDFISTGYTEVRPWCGEGWLGALHPANPVARGWRLFFEFHPIIVLYWLVERLLGLETVGFGANIVFALSMFPLLVVAATALLILVLEACGHFRAAGGGGGVPRPAADAKGGGADGGGGEDEDEDDDSDDGSSGDDDSGEEEEQEAEEEAGEEDEETKKAK